MGVGGEEGDVSVPGGSVPGAEHAAGVPYRESLIAAAKGWISSQPTEVQEGFSRQMDELSEADQENAYLGLAKELMQKSQAALAEQSGSSQGGQAGATEESKADKTQRLIAEGRAQGATDQVVSAAEEGEKRGLVDDEGNVTFDEKAIDDVVEAAGNAGIVPLEKGERLKIVNTVRAIDATIASKPQGEQLEDSASTNIAQQLESLGFRRDTEENKATENYLKRKNLTPEEISIINAKLSVRDPNDPNYKISDREANLKGGVIDRTRDVIDKNGDKNLKELQDRIDDPNTSEPERGNLRRDKERITGLITRMKDFFAPGEPGRDFVRRAGKTLYFTAFIAFLLILLEMNLINKAAGKKGR